MFAAKITGRAEYRRKLRAATGAGIGIPWNFRATTITKKPWDFGFALSRFCRHARRLD